MSSVTAAVSIAASIDVLKGCTEAPFPCTGLCLQADARPHHFGATAQPSALILGGRLHPRPDGEASAEALLVIPGDLAAEVPIGDLPPPVPPLLALRECQL